MSSKPAPPDPSAPHILLLAGEASGDQHGAEVAHALRRRLPHTRLTGLGGPRMAAAGVSLLAGLDDLAVMGFVEVLSRLYFFWRLEKRLVGLLDAGGVDLLLPIDYPGLNLRMARHARRRGIPVLYYIAPQVWAWKARRSVQLARDADRIAVILPFEEAFLARWGARATFVGHPLVERPDDVVDREAFARAAGLDPARPILALLPGSRRQELARHLGPFAEAARLVREARPDVQPVLGRAASLPGDALAPAGLPVVDDTRALLRHASAALVKSGTSTLEAALEETPFVVAYRTHPLTFELARRLVKIDHVALANLVAGRRVVTELLQGDATPRALADELLPLLDPDSPRRREVVEGLRGVRGALGEPGAAERVAAIAEELLSARGDAAPAGRAS